MNILKQIIINNSESGDKIQSSVIDNKNDDKGVRDVNYGPNSNIVFLENNSVGESLPEDEDYMLSYNKYVNDFENDKIIPEPILSIASERYTVYPIVYNNVWKNYKDQLKINWVVEEVDLSKDVSDWNNSLSENDRIFIMHVLAFFASADGIVNANIKENLIDVVKIKEAECAYGKQFEMENAHGEMYSLMLDTFIKDDILKEKLIKAIKTMPSIKKKADWCNKWIKSDKTYAHKLVAFAIVEGVFFSGSFASIFWLKTRQGNVMPGLIKSNKFIARDENKHVELASILFSLLKNKLKESVVYEIIDEAIQIEDEFINDSLPCRLLGMNSELMSQYIKYVADRLLVQLGYRKKYFVENPFEYMKKIDVFVKANFFEERNDAYSDAKIDNPRIFTILETGF
ncbi:ribonucleotide reductase small subunit [Moumouvirus australiensis]|uniref:Ribonucleoside-diphosphate reductase small chain n=1 Tax=Moumouvirus australiensis TaxID=2109587 RepID=A0A2P1ELZ2_9VIRU|nr:ribonucleotide reductase small subunit [Moumouvirus australiensis]AVL94903.1 ribonucleotide reductase small subunit [Moumouvirus australiensis]